MAEFPGSKPSQIGQLRGDFGVGVSGTGSRVHDFGYRVSGTGFHGTGLRIQGVRHGTCPTRR